MFTKVECNDEGLFRIRADGVGKDGEQTVYGLWTLRSQVAYVLVEGRELAATVGSVGGDAMSPGVVYRLS